MAGMSDEFTRYSKRCVCLPISDVDRAPCLSAGTRAITLFYVADPNPDVSAMRLVLQQFADGHYFGCHYFGVGTPMFLAATVDTILGRILAEAAKKGGLELAPALLYATAQAMYPLMQFPQAAAWFQVTAHDATAAPLPISSAILTPSTWHSFARTCECAGCSWCALCLLS